MLKAMNIFTQSAYRLCSDYKEHKMIRASSKTQHHVTWEPQLLKQPDCRQDRHHLAFALYAGQQEADLKAALLGSRVLGCFVLLLALLGHSPRQLMQQSLCHNVHPPSGRVFGLDISEVRVHAECQVAGQCPAPLCSVAKLHVQPSRYFAAKTSIIH